VPFSARGQCHARITDGEEQNRLVLFEFEVTIPENGRPPTFAVYADREADATPDFFRVCNGEAGEMVRDWAQSFRVVEPLSLVS
jgi:hypothetical protein